MNDLRDPGFGQLALDEGDELIRRHRIELDALSLHEESDPLLGRAIALEPISGLRRGIPRADTSFTAMLLEHAGNTADLDRAAFQRDASAAVTLLSTWLDALDPAGQRRLVEYLLPRLFGDPIFEREIEPPLLPIDVMERLVRIAFRTVRVEDDNHHKDGEVYTTDGRDAAERARGPCLAN